MPIILLKMLISLGGCDVRADQIADLLWPNADGDLAHHSFEINIHRLRRLLGHQDVILLREGRISLNERFCWVDTWAFERLLKISEQFKNHGNIEEALRIIEKALGLYKGFYLGKDTEEPWMFSARERLRSKFLRSVGWVAQQREREGKWELAAECYERCLDVDDCVEETYRRLMCCYQSLGRCGEALGVYRRCQRTLHVLFDIEPSSETQAIYKDLLISQKSVISHPPISIHGAQRIVRR